MVRSLAVAMVNTQVSWTWWQERETILLLLSRRLVDMRHKSWSFLKRPRCFLLSESWLHWMFSSLMRDIVSFDERLLIHILGSFARVWWRPWSPLLLGLHRFKMLSDCLDLPLDPFYILPYAFPLAMSASCPSPSNLIQVPSLSIVTLRQSLCQLSDVLWHSDCIKQDVFSFSYFPYVAKRLLQCQLASLSHVVIGSEGSIASCIREQTGPLKDDLILENLISRWSCLRINCEHFADQEVKISRVPWRDVCEDASSYLLEETSHVLSHERRPKCSQLIYYAS